MKTKSPNSSLTAISLLENKLKEITAERDSLKKELDSLKNSLSKNGISIIKGKPYIKLYAGVAGQHCCNCDFGGDWQLGCSVNRNCYLENCKLFSISELKKLTSKYLHQEDNSAELESSYRALQDFLEDMDIRIKDKLETLRCSPNQN